MKPVSQIIQPTEEDEGGRIQAGRRSASLAVGRKTWDGGDGGAGESG